VAIRLGTGCPPVVEELAENRIRMLVCHMQVLYAVLHSA
jgi:hypothetical protein